MTMSSDVQIRRVRPDEWRSWREVRLRMLRDDSDFFSSRYEDAVRDPDERWRTWVAEAADETADKVLLCADAGPEGWVGVVGGFVRVDRGLEAGDVVVTRLDEESLIAIARARPDGLNYASPGPGSAAHKK